MFSGGRRSIESDPFGSSADIVTVSCQDRQMYKKFLLSAQDCPHFQLGYRPPYAFDELLSFLERRAIPGVEWVADNTYRRCVRLNGEGGPVDGWLAVSDNSDRCCLDVRLSPSLLPLADVVLARLRRLFDSDCVPADVAAVLGDMAVAPAGLRLPGAFDGFEVAVRAILGQQITVRAATTLAGRLAARFGRPQTTPWPQLAVSFPTASTLAAVSCDALGELGVIRSRQVAIQAIATACVMEELALDRVAHTPSEADTVIKQLLALPGIGDWTAQYIAMRALHVADAWPYSDHAVKKVLGLTAKKDLQRAADAWRPYRSYATLYIWQSLSA